MCTSFYREVYLLENNRKSKENFLPTFFICHHLLEGATSTSCLYWEWSQGNIGSLFVIQRH